ncbi:MAG TPA: protein-disulfide reductase DsbD domain-containing protein [Terracidiphilus sp.]|nr:protein-disulfide reductase DsbD domain-containing protein [Terracidiphilus sp.]
MRGLISAKSKVGGACVAVAALALWGTITSAQIVPASGQGRAQSQTQAVTYLFPEQVTVPAGKPSAVALHFRIAPGLHINSHTPSDEYLIPTVFSIPADSSAHLDAAKYPAGTEITLAVDPKTKLSVYTGDFVIEARLVAAPGNHLVQGKLHYQACDRNECMPPKTITVPIDVIAR